MNSWHRNAAARALPGSTPAPEPAVKAKPRRANDMRAIRAEATLRVYMVRENVDGETALRDLLIDLMHLAVRMDISELYFEDELKAATDHFKAEMSGN